MVVIRILLKLIILAVSQHLPQQIGMYLQLDLDLGATITLLQIT